MSLIKYVPGEKPLELLCGRHIGYARPMMVGDKLVCNPAPQCTGLGRSAKCTRMAVRAKRTYYAESHLDIEIAMASTERPQASSNVKVETSKTGIPKAPFIEDVEAHLGGADEDAEPHLRKFQETMSKYKMMEGDRRQRLSALEDKIPDIKKTLQMVEHLRSKRVRSQTLDVSL